MQVIIGLLALLQVLFISFPAKAQEDNSETRWLDVGVDGRAWAGSRPLNPNGPA